MKMVKRLFTVLMSFLMVLVLAMPALAEGNTGSITIDNATVGKSYAIYKVFDATYSGTGDDAQIAYSYTKSGDTDALYEALKLDTSPFTLTDTVTTNVYNVSLKAGKKVTDVVSWLTNNIDKLAKTSETTAGSETVSFTQLVPGYYYVTSTLGSAVTITPVAPNATILDKNQDGGSEFTKKVDSQDEVVEFGTPFEFTLNFTATNYDGETQITEYTITDTLATGMDLVYEAEDTTYGVTIKVGENTVDDADIDLNDGVLTIRIPWTTTEAGTGTVSSKYSSPVNVQVTYSVKLTGAAPIQQDITNTATLTWTGDTTGTTQTETVQTYAMAIMKVDGKGNALSGATFTVKKGAAAVNVTAVPGQEGVYVVDPASKSNTVVSPASGLIVIKGVDSETYTLTETVAPAGYNLLPNPEEIKPASTGKTTITIYKDKDGNVVDTQVTEGTTDESTSATVPVTAKVVVNEAGAQLPSTGGMGTMLFYVIGAILVVAAGVLLVTKRRMKDDK